MTTERPNPYQAAPANRWPQRCATCDFVKQFVMFATLAPASGGSARSR